MAYTSNYNGSSRPSSSNSSRRAQPQRTSSSGRFSRPGSASGRPSNGRNSFAGRNAGRPQGGSRGGRGGRKGSFERIDVSRFINKSTITEQEEIYIPTHTFDSFVIDQRLKASIAKKQYIYPSPIQDKAIPHALDGQDIIGIANTGTGKTAAFLIPIINKILNNSSETAIIIAPTRELAIQIEKEFNDFAQGLRIYACVCVGGASIIPQIKNLRRGVSVVIGTPGRLVDLVNRKEINLSDTKNVVLDEADRMLDMGFLNDITMLIEKTHQDRQSFFFSATLPKPIENLIEKFSNHPIRIIVKTRDTAKNVEQDIIRVDRGTDKIDVLADLLLQPEFKKVVIFSEMKHAVEKLSVELIKRGYKAGSIHGDKRHNERQRTLKMFKEDQINILVATDVAARGLDIPDVTHVINYEIPQTYDTYVHRIGRTGRASKKGVALTFV